MDRAGELEYRVYKVRCSLDTRWSPIPTDVVHSFRRKLSTDSDASCPPCTAPGFLDKGTA